MRVAPKDFMETVDIFDPKLKIIAEELANPLGKKVIKLLSINERTLKQISTDLDVSLQAAAYHVNRLLKAKLVKINAHERSVKGKIMKKYALHKPSVLLILESSQQDKKTFLKRLEREALKRLVERILFSLTVFIGFYFIGHLIIQGGIHQGIVQPPPSDRDFSFTLSENPLFVIVPLVFGIISSLITWKILTRRLVSVNMSTFKRLKTCFQ
jgi:DNA-binding transcriptional ArsR family regulator